ncbi:radical SAM protein [Kitasatospora sp. NPDC094015]|uniref:radical SAM protein n=1 Tax=Kitasatospora sp. NPDC094015 TaxID=3155205 RepID=UPI00332142A0
MHLAELLTLGARPAAGLLLALTDRCPLACAHCSTDSTMDSAQSAGGPFRRLVAGFEPGCRPELILMSGGEPLLRPALVAELAASAARAGARSALLSGMFFARGGGLPPAIRRAVAGLHHFAASLDAQHEREVGRAEVFAALDAVLDLVPAASLHVTALPGPAGRDYLDGLVAEVRRRYGARLPMLVSAVQPTGRARDLLPAPAPGAARGGGPCEFAHWPLVDQDGTVYACTRQSLLRGGGPAHLVLGHAARDPWPVLRERALADPLLRSVRTLGPVATRELHGPAGGCAADACGSCLGLTAASAAGAADRLADPAGQRIERAVLALTSARSPRRLALARGALADYADLVELGWAG